MSFWFRVIGINNKLYKGFDSDFDSDSDFTPTPKRRRKRKKRSSKEAELDDVTPERKKGKRIKLEQKGEEAGGFSSNSNSNSHESKSDDESDASAGPSSVVNLEKLDEAMMRELKEKYPDLFHPGCVISVEDLVKSLIEARTCKNCSDPRNHLCASDERSLRKAAFNARCSICLGTVGTKSDGDESAVLTRCGHIHCTSCYFGHLSAQLQRNVDPCCPVCRSPVIMSNRARNIEEGLTVVTALESRAEGRLTLPFSQTSTSHSGDEEKEQEEEILDLSGYE